ncbi:MAG: hypothetical protein DMG08_21720 [Acidobacteria bacterium]|nr:MAG: hypothetical protein DMG08_21720 [Acidobacteriota bacterium]
MAGLATFRQERQNLTSKKLCVSLGSLLGSGFHPPSGNSVEEIQGEKEGQKQSKGTPISGKFTSQTILGAVSRTVR